ncbi:MAG: hypothetical protein GYA21_04885 [Myxococcales bacterium]|nr:hypothetical protein [Myxococcales bacterium]
MNSFSQLSHLRALHFLAGACLFAWSCNKAPAEPAGSTSDAAAKAPAATSASAILPDGVVALYFHGDRRCRTCLGIQEGIEKIIRERFGAEQTAARLHYREVNSDREENRALVQQFQISFSSLIVARVKDGKVVDFENCDKVWEYAHEPERFAEYVEKQLRARLTPAGDK